MGVASFELTALTHNLRGVRLIAYAGPDLEPFGVTVTIGCLGTPPFPLNPFTVSERLAHSRKETRWMKRTLIRYVTKPGRAEENQRLIEGVFRELHAKAPSGVRYMALRLDTGTFVHFVEVDDADGSNPLPELDAFRLFQNGIRDRQVEPAQLSSAAIIGNYRMLRDE